MQEPAHRWRQGGQRRRAPSATGWASSRSRGSRCTGPRRTGWSSTSRRTAASTSTTPRPYLGKGNFEAQDMLHARYGKKVTIGLCGPVGEYQGLLAGIAFSDKDGRPGSAIGARGCGRGDGGEEGQGHRGGPGPRPAVSRGQEGQRRHQGLRQDAAGRLDGDELLRQDRHHGHGRLQNTLGGLPVRNFSAGPARQLSRRGEKFKMGGDYISQLNVSRGGDHTHACMPGCVIQCSNVYHDADREGSGLAGGVRDARPARHELRHQRSGRPRPAQLHRQRSRRRHDRDWARCWPC